MMFNQVAVISIKLSYLTGGDGFLFLIVLFKYFIKYLTYMLK